MDTDVDSGARVHLPFAYLFGCFAFAAIVAWTVLAFPRAEDIDSSSYRMMARGVEVCRPYANRVLHPAVVRGICRCTGVTPETAFVVTTLSAAVVFYLAVLALLRNVRPRPLVFAWLISPLWWAWPGNFFIQDMFAAALTALLFLAVRTATGPERRPMAVVAVGLLVFALQVTRESTPVLVSVLVVLAAMQRRWRLAMVAFAACIAGGVVVTYATRHALPNMNELNGGVYLVCKVLANGLRNFTGLIPWNDGYAARLACYYPDAPLWKCTLPACLQFGNIHEVGVYAFAPEAVLHTFMFWLFSFPGALALTAWTLFRRRQRGLPALGTAGWRKCPFHVQLAACAGGLFWLLTPFSGPSLVRLAGYAWPLFWIALPALCRKGEE